MNTHDIEQPPLPEMEVLGHDAYQKPIYGYSSYTVRYLLRQAIEADRQGRFIKERAQLEREWSMLKNMQAQYKTDRQRGGEPQECGCCGRSDECDPDCDAARPAEPVDHIGDADEMVEPVDTSPVRPPMCRIRGVDPGVLERPAKASMNAGPVKVPSDGIQRDLSGETWMGMRVAAWQWEEDSPIGKITNHATHWSAGPKNAERLYRERDIRALLGPLRHPPNRQAGPQ